MPCLMIYASLTCQTLFPDATTFDPTLPEYRRLLEHEAYLCVQNISNAMSIDHKNLTLHGIFDVPSCRLASQIFEAMVRQLILVLPYGYQPESPPVTSQLSFACHLLLQLVQRISPQFGHSSFSLFVPSAED